MFFVHLERLCLHSPGEDRLVTKINPAGIGAGLDSVIKYETVVVPTFILKTTLVPVSDPGNKLGLTVLHSVRYTGSNSHMWESENVRCYLTSFIPNFCILHSKTRDSDQCEKCSRIPAASACLHFTMHDSLFLQ